MAQDIVPDLLAAIQSDFEARFSRSATVKRVQGMIDAGTATYAEANEYAIEVGNLLAASFKANLSSNVLPDGEMYYNIAQRILQPTLSTNHDLIATAAAQIQTDLNRAAGLGIKGLKVDLNQDRIDGLINRLSSEDLYDDVAWLLDEPVVTASQSIVDDTIQKNVEFQAKAGLRPKLVRKLVGKACKWCRALAGTYDYPDVPDDIYRRHERCRCTVEYDPGTGKIQNVHSKEWSRVDDGAKIEEQKAFAASHQAGREFPSKELLEHHYNKHEEEYGTISIPEYVRQANALADESVSEDVVQLKRSDGSISKYRSSTNDFVVINEDGTIRTFFKPKDGKDYWTDEIERNK